MKTIETVADLVADPKRANMGTDRGRQLLEESVAQCGAGRSIVVDKHGTVIAGNRMLDVARQRNMPVTVVQATGESLVVVQRTDLQLASQPSARQLAYYDNRVQEVGLAWSPRQVQADLLDGVSLASSFFPEELDKITAPLPEPRLQDHVPAVVTDHLATSSPTPPASPTAVPMPPIPMQELDKPAAPRGPTYVVYFDGPLQQLRWTSFQRALKDHFKNVATQPARLSAWIAESGIGEPV